MEIKNLPKKDQNLMKINELIQQNLKSCDSMKKNYNCSTPTKDISKYSFR